MNNGLNKRKIGQLKEKLAADFLVDKGYEILETNYRTAYQEIDIIARDRDTIVFIEVKYRKDEKFGSPFEAVSINKQKRICMGAVSYLKTKQLLPDNTSVRFDAIGITGNKISHIKNAFDFSSLRIG